MLGPDVLPEVDYAVCNPEFSDNPFPYIMALQQMTQQRTGVWTIILPVRWTAAVIGFLHEALDGTPLVASWTVLNSGRQSVKHVTPIEVVIVTWRATKMNYDWRQALIKYKRVTFSKQKTVFDIVNQYYGSSHAPDIGPQRQGEQARGQDAPKESITSTEDKTPE